MSIKSSQLHRYLFCVLEMVPDSFSYCVVKSPVKKKTPRTSVVTGISGAPPPHKVERFITIKFCAILFALSFLIGTDFP